jgi:NAD+ kinase
VARRLYDAEVDGERAATVLRDAMLVTDEPARISEYAVRSGDRVVARFRADGVVVATPAGSRGYLSAAGGPIVEPGTRTLAAVPVAPFQTESDDWVLDDAAVSLTVHRDTPVLLVVDGRETRIVPREGPVSLVPAGELALYAAAGDWKNSNGGRPE